VQPRKALGQVCEAGDAIGTCWASTNSQRAKSQHWTSSSKRLAITLTVFGFSLLGDVLRDALDLKLRDR